MVLGLHHKKDDTYKKIPQLGNVLIRDNVEIGANTVIDCATLGSTIIEKGVKLDNLVQIAHNVEIGENTVIASQTGISGSAKFGKKLCYSRSGWCCRSRRDCRPCNIGS